MCSDLDVGLTASDWLTLKQTVLPPTRDDEDSSKSGGTNGGNEEMNNMVVLGDFLSELQSLRRGLGGKGERRSSRGTPEVRFIDILSLNNTKLAVNIPKLIKIIDYISIENKI